MILTADNLPDDEVFSIVVAPEAMPRLIDLFASHHIDLNYGRFEEGSWIALAPRSMRPPNE